MSDVLYSTVKDTLLDFATTMNQLCDCQVNVLDIKNIEVILPKDSIYSTLLLPPLFSVSFRATVEDQVLNKKGNLIVVSYYEFVHSYYDLDIN